MEKTASEVLRAAKALIGTPEKWMGGLHRKSGKCVAVAICYAQGSNGYPDYSPSKNHEYFITAIGGDEGNGCSPIWTWNDACYRTHADVMEAFDKAIALAEKDENLQRQPKESDSDWAARMVREVTTPELGLTREKSEAR